MSSQDLGSFLSQIPTDDGLDSSINDSHSDDFMELSLLGYLTADVDWCGHHFVIRTLKVGEEIIAGKLIKRDEESVAAFKATHTVVVAAALVEVDGVPFLPPLGKDDLEHNIRQRYKYLQDNWFWPTVEFLAAEHNKLVKRQAEVVIELQKKSLSGQRDSFDLSAPLNDKESSTES